ncbi:DNA-binding transcriptional regulator, MocR family, contains an aminotransferase domain [Paenibacillus sp. cl6col]|uniref:MocR-like pyridoxine biosynthesis transcription factor PdxR n=1 Tax=Paenibacillus TaxID=44249 RepID=UPI0003865A89|nr:MULTISPECIES: PLP-dependent aminotransferase family protein [Paenibacillus]EPY11854.1 GntR family transcriptional regulator [Paenibacillus alvei A6-6i-x]SDG05128.1 DNA-binding transcriptional regulator, MocR family, contains an aminotransferase domain [Paenibacillus sp. cl6col]
MFQDFKLIPGRPAYLQVRDYLRLLINRGWLTADQKLPSTRELGNVWGVSRNTVIAAYQELADEGLIYSIPGQGSYASPAERADTIIANMDWNKRMSEKAQTAERMDVMKHGVRGERGMISFMSIAPDESLFPLQYVKQALVDRIAAEGEIMLNYGYAQGYQPLIEELKQYMESKGIDMKGKDMLITNGFTEGLDIVLSAMDKRHGRVICENPTHHSAIKLFKMHGLEIEGIAMEHDGMNMEQVTNALEERSYDLAYLIPSYQNPTGVVMSPSKRMTAIRLFAKHGIPVIEDGFSEELRYSGAHVAPLIACAGGANHVIYIGSFSKILFPGMRIGWIIADEQLISYLVSMKRARTIHTSTLDQAVLYQYLHNGHFESYLKKAKSVYKRKYEWAVQCCEQHIPLRRLWGDGGLHLFIELDPSVNVEDVLMKCREQGVLFTPGSRFYTDGGGANTFRIGFSRVSEPDIERGTRIIGNVIKQIIQGG